MGSYCSLHFDDIEVISWKSEVPDSLISLFQESDRADRVVEEHGDSYRHYLYVAPRSVVLERLDILGLTQAAARAAFDDWRQGELEMYKEWVDEGSDWAEDTLKALQSLSFEEWSKRITGVLRTRYSDDAIENRGDETNRRMQSGDESWLWFEAPDDRLPLRVMLDACADTQNVILDITDLVGGGWLDEDVELCRSARSPEAVTRPIFEPTVILGEGSSDVRVLRLS